VQATVMADGSVTAGAAQGSIHKIGALVQNAPSCNGWTFWHIERDGAPVVLDTLRAEYITAASAV
jgi:modification methylase